MDFGKIKEVLKSIIMFQKKEISSTEQTNRNRIIVSVVLVLLIINYLMICFHVGRNPFDVLPSWPITDARHEITIYLPHLDGKTIFSEKRLSAKNENLKYFIRELVEFVIKGSIVENTKEAVPIDGNIRKIWLYEDKCIVDMYLEVNKKNIVYKKGREINFKKALQKTITENVPGVKEVIVLSKGIPGKNIWEVTQN